MCSRTFVGTGSIDDRCCLPASNGTAFCRTEGPEDQPTGPEDGPLSEDAQGAPVPSIGAPTCARVLPGLQHLPWLGLAANRSPWLERPNWTYGYFSVLASIKKSILIRFRVSLDAEMARTNSVETKKLQLTVDVTTDHLIGEIASLGLHGTSKSEVACSILRMWLWDNQARLRENGIELRRTPSLPSRHD